MLFLKTTGGQTGNPVSATDLGDGVHWYCWYGQGFDFYTTSSISITQKQKLVQGINSIKAEDTTASPTPFGHLPKAKCGLFAEIVACSTWVRDLFASL